MTIVELMADHRKRQVYGHDTPLPEDSDLVRILGNALMLMAREWVSHEKELAEDVRWDEPKAAPPAVTMALALFHTWEAARK
jgi:hypothetical protein